jgi:AraC-like DNA-binding protein
MTFERSDVGCAWALSLYAGKLGYSRMKVCKGSLAREGTEPMMLGITSPKHVSPGSAQPSAVTPSMLLEQRLRFSSRSLEEVHAHMNRSIEAHDLAVDERGALAFRHHSAALGRLSINAIHYGMEAGHIRVSVPAITSKFLLQVSLHGNSHFRAGRHEFDLPAGTVTVLAPGFKHEQILSPDYRHLLVCIPRRLVETALQRELGCDGSHPIAFQTAPFSEGTPCAALWRMVKMICDDLDSRSPVLGHPRIAASLEDTLIRTILATIPNTYSDHFNSLSELHTPYYLRRAEEYVRQNAVEPITLEDIVRAAGVSTRTLHSSFRDYRGTTPLAYLKAHRLDLARSQLESAVKQQQTVTEIAFACGFNHLSKFARDYQLRFGETPSQTRRRGIREI